MENLRNRSVACLSRCVSENIIRKNSAICELDIYSLNCNNLYGSTFRERAILKSASIEKGRIILGASMALRCERLKPAFSAKLSCVIHGLDAKTILRLSREDF